MPENLIIGISQKFLGIGPNCFCVSALAARGLLLSPQIPYYVFWITANHRTYMLSTSMLVFEKKFLEGEQLPPLPPTVTPML